MKRTLKNNYNYTFKYAESTPTTSNFTFNFRTNRRESYIHFSY
jgi:hypothetical protein